MSKIKQWIKKGECKTIGQVQVTGAGGGKKITKKNLKAVMVCIEILLSCKP